ncbi:MAP kinase kinase (MEK) [Mortierella polycephala]|uniref:MAP kinase kinase (MEK) n=1 Tax=Mortierella polycephala TaxID=41804 RepID=A0A9P6PSI2_9FUNG|nr:MAP kinase kinase (MEK) [Mortierella polycephala]
MISPGTIRKKRNFKNLALDESANENAPPGGSAHLHNVPLRRGASGATGATGGAGPAHYSRREHLPDLELGVEFKLDLRSEDLQTLEELGAGNGGTVSRVIHLPTKSIMARKVIHIDAQPAVRKQILRELQIMHDCNHPNIVSFYGAFLHESEISYCMEYMDVGALDGICAKNGAFPMDVIGLITVSVLKGLSYLYHNHKIVHRDLKPSNILINSTGMVKICDFGVSGQLVNSIANTFVGTSNYMSPERIRGWNYGVQSDVWSLGITLMELALGRFPLDAECKSLTILELLQHIVNEPLPTLPRGEFPEDFCNFIDICLAKNVESRPSPDILATHPYYRRAEKEKVDMEHWVSHLHK